MDWDLKVLTALRQGGAGFQADRVPWEEIVALWQSLGAAEQAELGRKLLEMLDFGYRNPHSEEPYTGDGLQVLPLPGGMKPEDLLCVEAAAFAAVHLGLPGVRPRLQALMRAPLFHAVYPHLRRLHLEIGDLLAQARPETP